LAQLPRGSGAGSLALTSLLGWVRALLTDYAYGNQLIALLLCGEAVLGLLIMWRVPYTEIDWVAYMQEVQGFLGGDWDYANLRGDTGPLVYPAGFVYLFSALYYVSDLGKNILLAQGIFYLLYLANAYVVMAIYRESRGVPPWTLVLLCLSRRVHSIFVLRCFNDCFAMFFLYIAVLLLVRDRWTWGCVWFSLAVSIKMNVLLFAPCLGILLLRRLGFWRAMLRVGLCVGLQVLLALPFLLTFPASYFKGAFDFGREFFYVWTVNLKFLSEEHFLVMQGPYLVVAHLAVLMLVAHCMYRPYGGWWGVLCSSFSSSPSATNLPAREIVGVLFVSNFIGIAFAKSLHFQFYCWYFHTLPYLVFLTPLPAVVGVAWLVAVEVVWNVFPAQAWTALLLQACHAVLLLGLLATPQVSKGHWAAPPSKGKRKTMKKK
jgi:alpha-1,3-mannosyltransferase